MNLVLVLLMVVFCLLPTKSVRAEDEDAHDTSGTQAKSSVDAEEDDDHEQGEEHEEGEEEEEEEALGGVGKEMAVTAFDPHHGLKLSPEAVATLAIQTTPFAGDAQQIPPGALVHHERETGIYRYDDGWYRRVPLTDLKSGDLIVTNGAQFLRIAELDAQSGDEAGDDD